MKQSGLHKNPEVSASPCPRIFTVLRKYHGAAEIAAKFGDVTELAARPGTAISPIQSIQKGSIIITDLPLPFEVPGAHVVSISRHAFSALTSWRVEPSLIGAELLPVLEKIKKVICMEQQAELLIADLEQADAMFMGALNALVHGEELHCRNGFGHGNRVSTYATLLSQRLNSEANAGMSFDENELRAIRLAAYVHDIGKMVVDINILQKETRLSYSQMANIRSRFGQAIQAIYQGGDLREKITEFETHYSLIYKVNQMNELPESTIEKIKAIGALRWKDSGGRKRSLLTGEELEVLSMPRGNLTLREWEEIKAHPHYSELLLTDIPWPRELAHVPFLTRLHHEALNGRGTPDGRKAEDIPVAARIITLCDRYDALSAPGREYKRAHSPSEAIAILSEEVEKGELDRRLLEVFVQGNIHINSLINLPRVEPLPG